MKVTLIGDSIRQIGYGRKVPELLGNDFTVWQPSDNCRFAQYTMRGVMWDWKKDMAGSDIVHWNNGLWDICDLVGDGPFTPLNVYTDTILRIAKVLSGMTKKIIFATTTPVTSANAHDKNEWIIEYNNHIVPLLQNEGVIINDLHALVYPNIDRYIRKDDNIHLTEERILSCAEQTAKVIRETAKLI